MWDPTADSDTQMYQDEEDEHDSGDGDRDDDDDDELVNDDPPTHVPVVPATPAEEDTLSIDTNEDDFYPATDEPAEAKCTIPLEPVVFIQKSPETEAGSDSPSSVRDPQRLSSIFSSMDSFRTAPDHMMLGSLEDNLNDDEDDEDTSPGGGGTYFDKDDDDDDDHNRTLRKSDNPQNQMNQYAKEQQQQQQPKVHFAPAANGHGSGSDSESDARTATPTRNASTDDGENFNFLPPSDFNANVNTSPGSTQLDVADPPSSVSNNENNVNNEQAINNPGAAPDSENHFDFENEDDKDVENSEDDKSQEEDPLVPVGTQPLEPPQGKSPGIPLKKGRKMSKEKRKS